ncbi:hypothetical protein [Citreimonas salinaria]|uniref:Uncharacterized protein n=1 Tax=Citreimonas salinaria TaxID=321339 RepID=A0A1H3LZK1_9RHOB|nr:hypothetical protein [Citreimonas salinaria]SDY69753.1 hypothetical protein SAMN05444340_11516 [Citreimonas salinaria]
MDLRKLHGQVIRVRCRCGESREEQVTRDLIEVHATLEKLSESLKCDACGDPGVTCDVVFIRNVEANYRQRTPISTSIMDADGEINLDACDEMFEGVRCEEPTAERSTAEKVAPKAEGKPTRKRLLIRMKQLRSKTKTGEPSRAVNRIES